MRLIIIYAVLIFLSACTNQVDTNSNTKLQNNSDSSTLSSNQNQASADTTKANNEIDWTRLDDLNSDIEHLSLHEDSIIGIGIITLSDSAYSSDKKLSLYAEKEKLLATIDASDSDVVTVFKGKPFHWHDSTDPLLPRVYTKDPDYFALAFDCINTDKNFYTVLINRKTGQMAKIKKKDNLFVFKTITQYIDDWTYFGFYFNRSTNPLHQLPNDTSKIITHTMQSKYKIWRADKVVIKGDWVEVQIENTSEKGWLRWRQGNQILINLYFAC